MKHLNWQIFPRCCSSVCAVQTHISLKLLVAHISHTSRENTATLAQYLNIYLIHCVQKNSTENECVWIYSYSSYLHKKKKRQQNQKKSWSTLSNLYKKKCRGWKVKKQKQTKKKLLQSHKRHKWLFSQKTHNIGDPQRDSSFPSLTLTTQTPPGFRRVQRWQAAALLTIA